LNLFALDPDADATKVFVMVVLHCDHYFSLKNEADVQSSLEKDGIQFFHLLKRFPLDIQMVICNR